MPNEKASNKLAGLVTKSQAGDLDAFETLVRRFQRMAVATCYALLGDAGTAEDAAQEAFLEAYRSLNQLREPAAFAAWLRLILRKQCDRIARRRRPSTLPLEAAQELPAASDPVADLESKEQAGFVHAALLELTAAEREAVLLFYFAELSQNEIADFLGVSVDAVKNRLRSARRKLKEGLSIMTEPTGKPAQPSADFAERVMRVLRAAALEKAADVAAMLDADPALVSGEGEHPYWAGKPVVPPLIVATEWGRADIVRELLDRGADPNWHGATNDRWTALQLAIHHGRPEHLEVAKLLTARGAVIDIWAASAMGDAARVRALLQADPSLTRAPGPNNAPPLHYAASAEIVDLLLAAGADPDAHDKYDQTAAERIASYGSRRREAGVRLLRVTGKKDVFLSCALGDLVEVERALNADPSLVRARKPDRLMAPIISARGEKPVGETLLHVASQLGHEDIAQLLAVRGADVNARADVGVTPLHLAARNGHTHVAAILLDNGAELNAIEDLHNSTPYGWAVFQRRPEVAEFLKARGGHAGAP
ncbi:MAG: sigma-70 family RNA polymerase sigma factor [Alphaproteobacteria bacterium]